MSTRRSCKRIYEVDPLVCPSCGSEMEVIAFITEHAVVDKILRHLKRQFSWGIRVQDAWYARWCGKANSYPLMQGTLEKQIILFGQLRLFPNSYP